MFSLIITIVSIALVAALALATLFYGGAAFNKGAADAEASKLLLQGQQLLGAAELYFAEHNTWPASAQELVDKNYLKAVPQAAGELLTHATAAGIDWGMPQSGVPLFLLSGAASQDTCGALNAKGSLRKGVVLPQAYSALLSQCYQGRDAQGNSVYKVVFKKFGDVHSLEPLPDEEVASTPLPPESPANPENPDNPDSPTPPAAMSVSPASWDAADVDVGQERAQTFTVRNTGAQTGLIDAASWAAQNAYFTLTSDGCSGVQLAAGDECSVTVRFQPTYGSAASATLNLAGVQVALSGQGVGTPQFSLNTASYTFPQGIAGEQYNHQFVVSNTGTEDLTLQAPAFAPGSATTFSLVETGSTCAAGLVLSVAQSCILTVQYAPLNSADASAAALDVAVEGLATQQLALQGTTGISYASWDPARLNASNTLNAEKLVLTDIGNSTFSNTHGTVAKSSGKYYFEVHTNYGIGEWGIVQADSTAYLTRAAVSAADPLSAVWDISGVYRIGGVSRGTTSSAAAGVTVGIAIDLDNKTLRARIKSSGGSCGNLFLGQSFSTLGATQWRPVVSSVGTTTGTQMTANFGSKPFACSVPTGYQAGWY